MLVKKLFSPSKWEEEFERQPLRGSEGAMEGCPRLRACILRLRPCHPSVG